MQGHRFERLQRRELLDPDKPLYRVITRNATAPVFLVHVGGSCWIIADGERFTTSAAACLAKRWTRAVSAGCRPVQVVSYRCCSFLGVELEELNELVPAGSPCMARQMGRPPSAY